MMSKISPILQQLMFNKKIRTTELARRVNLPQPTVHRIVSGISPRPHLSSLQPLADFFGISVAQLKGNELIPELSTGEDIATHWMEVPQFNWNDLPNWPLPTSDRIASLLVAKENVLTENAFALKVPDSSMEPLFPCDSIIILDPQKTPGDRSYVLVKLHAKQRFLFRQLICDGDKRFLKALSSHFKDFQLQQLQADDRIYATLVQARRDFV